MAAAAKTPAVGYEHGDTVYAHADDGPRVLRVLCSGADGFTGEDEDGNHHEVPHDRYLGHHKRVKHAYEVEMEGEDGCIVRDETGQRRFIKGKPPAPPEGKPPRDAAHRFSKLHTEDLRLGPAHTLTKALMPLPPLPALPNGRVLMFKARGPSSGGTWITVHPNGPDSKGSPVLIKDGKVIGGVGGNLDGKSIGQEKDAPAAKPKKADGKVSAPRNAAKHKHGDLVAFRHGDVEGQGRIVGSGKDGVSVTDEETGREHLVRHDALLPDHPRQQVEKKPENSGGSGSPDERLAAAKTAHATAFEKYQNHTSNPPAKNKKAHSMATEAFRQDLRSKTSEMMEAMEAAGYDAFTGKKRRDMDHVYSKLEEYMRATFSNDIVKNSSTIGHDVPAFFLAGATGEPMPTISRAANDYAQKKQDALLNAAYEAGSQNDPERSGKELATADKGDTSESDASRGAPLESKEKSPK